MVYNGVTMYGTYRLHYEEKYVHSKLDCYHVRRPQYTLFTAKQIERRNITAVSSEYFGMRFTCIDLD